MTDTDTAPDRGALRPPVGDDITGRLRTQTGPRTTAPMWARPLMTAGEWAAYTALWSFASWNGDSTFPSHQQIADRAWIERGSAANAVRKFAKLGLLAKARRTRADGSDTSSDYVLVEVCPDALIGKLTGLMADRIAEQTGKRKERRRANRASRARTAAARASAGEAEDAGEDLVDAYDDETMAAAREAAEQLAGGALEGGASHNAPPGVHQPMHPGGTPHDGPGYTEECTRDLSIDLPRDNQSPPRASARDAAAAAGPAEAVTRGESDSLGRATRDSLNAAVERAVALRAGAAGWSVGQVRAAVRTAVDAGDAPADVVAALDRIAADPDTRAPGRLRHAVAELVAARGRPAPAAAGDADPGETADRYRHAPVVPPGAPRCNRHPDQPAGPACPLCDQEQADAERERLDADAARQLAAERIAAARARRAAAGTRHRPTRTAPDPTAVAA